ncbi:hypothetical protein [Porphyromonas gulae]|uniref:hypothetical protein n=1 Tax=Porphyromonas gulae TaxID=111105 RepID=UPI0026EA2D9D|nr:hypothetical protein [Porphyromonas gulae]
MKKALTTSFVLAASILCGHSVFAQQVAPAHERDYDMSEYFELTSALNVGQQVKLFFKGGNDVWIDLNNNQQFEEGEQALVNTTNYNMYTLGSQTIRIYGKVKEFLCRDSRLTAVDFTHFPKIEVIGVSKNELTSIDITKNHELNYIECNSNKLTELNVTGMDKLTLISCQDNKISKLDISNKPGLYFISIAKNNIKETEMEEIVKNLPQMTLQSPGALFAAVLSASEGNIMTVDQVAQAEAKKWDVMAWNGSAWVDYEGTETSLNSVEATPSRLTARYSDGMLHLENLIVGKAIRVYGLDGRLAFETMATSESMSISCGMRLGFYLISNGANRTTKLFIGE